MHFKSLQLVCNNASLLKMKQSKKHHTVLWFTFFLLAHSSTHFEEKKNSLHTTKDIMKESRIVLSPYTCHTAATAASFTYILEYTNLERLIVWFSFEKQQPEQRKKWRQTREEKKRRYACDGYSWFGTRAQSIKVCRVKRQQVPCWSSALNIRIR